jgi:hypothetical protein
MLIYRAKIPDFITGHEIYYTDYKSYEYKNFISQKIAHFFSNEHEYNIIPIPIIWLKLSKLFNSYFLMIIYNRLFDAIRYFPPTVCYNNYKYIKNEPQNQIIVSDKEVYSSCLFDAFENFQINEFLNLYIEKIFHINNYDLLNSELDFLDTHDIAQSKYDNLKYLVFRTGLTQWQLSNKNERKDLTKLFDLNNLPNYQSIRFSIYISWALCQKILLNNIEPINYIDDTTLNINKLYNYFIYLINDTNGLLNKLIKWLNLLDWDKYEKETISKGSDKLNLLDMYNVNTLFNESNQLSKAYYDYPTNPQIKIKDVIDDNYILINLSNIIEQSIYDNVEDHDNTETDMVNNQTETDIVNDQTEIANNQISNTLKGGNNNVVGIYKSVNMLTDIISTVPICKIANIIQFVKSK